jgi:hypothetical protein
MAVSPLPLFVVVIDRAGARSGASADECAFPPADQRAGSCANRCSNADTLRGLLFTRLRVSITPALTARNRNRQRECEHQQQN